ncbi:MAG: HdeD family acid-resistance protein [Acetobacteraceae bacterium]
MPPSTDPAPMHWTGIRSKWGLFVALGIGLIVLGVIAWLDVVSVTIAGTILIGALLLIGGIFQVIHAFMTREWAGFLFGLFCGVLAFIAGILIMREPVRGALVLTIVITALLAVGGITRIVLAFRHRGMSRWGLLLLSGIVSLGVAALLYAELPWSGLWVLGTLIAVELVIQGIAWLSFGLALRKAR